MKLKNFAQAHKPQICFGLGMAFYLGALLEVAKATVTATRIVDRRKQEIAEESVVDITPEEVKLPAKDVFKLTYRCYLGPVGMVITSLGLMGGSMYTVSKNNSELMTSYILSKAASDNFKEAAVEVVGENKVKKIEEKAAENSFAEYPVPANPECTGDGNTLYYIPYFHYYFRSSPDSVNRGILEFLKKLNHVNESQSLGDLLGDLNCFPERYQSNDISNSLGWRAEDDLDITVRWKENGSEPCGLIIFSKEPCENFYRYSDD